MKILLILRMSFTKIILHFVSFPSLKYLDLQFEILPQQFSFHLVRHLSSINKNRQPLFQSSLLFFSSKHRVTGANSEKTHKKRKWLVSSRQNIFLLFYYSVNKSPVNMNKLFTELFAKYSCTNCQEEIVGVTVHCSECEDFSLCLQVILFFLSN